jgi:hypothetical protein
MSTLVAILLAIIVLGMLLSYYVGYRVGHREGFDRGHQTGKKEGAVRAYAVGYDRGRHERQAKEAAGAEPEEPPRRSPLYWIWPILVPLLAVVAAAVLSARQSTP